MTLADTPNLVSFSGVNGCEQTNGVGVKVGVAEGVSVAVVVKVAVDVGVLVFVGVNVFVTEGVGVLKILSLASQANNASKKIMTMIVMITFGFNFTLLIYVAARAVG